MPISQTGGNYKNQSELQRRDRILGSALDDLASQVQAIRAQGKYGQAGSLAPPHPLTMITVSAAGGFATVSLTHNNAPAQSRYVIEHSSTPNFQPGTVVQVDNGISLSFQQYLTGLTRYFRAAPKFATSELASWVYYGGQANPTAVTF